MNRSLAHTGAFRVNMRRRTYLRAWKRLRNGSMMMVVMKP